MSGTPGRFATGDPPPTATWPSSAPLGVLGVLGRIDPDEEVRQELVTVIRGRVLQLTEMLGKVLLADGLRLHRSILHPLVGAAPYPLLGISGPKRSGKRPNRTIRVPQRRKRSTRGTNLARCENRNPWPAPG